MEVCPNWRLPKSIKVVLLLLCFANTIILISASVAENNGVEDGQNVATELEEEMNSDNKKRSVSLLGILRIPSAENIAQQITNTGIDKGFDTQPQPSPYYGLPKVFYNDLTNSEIFPEEREHNRHHRKGHGRQKKHGHHRHEQPPKLQIQSETHITVDIRNNSVPPGESKNKVNYIPQKLRLGSPSSTAPISIPKNSFIANRRKLNSSIIPSGPLRSDKPKTVNKSPELEEKQLMEQFKAYYKMKEQKELLRNRTRPSPIKLSDGNIFKSLGTYAGLLNLGTPQNISPKNSIIGVNKYKVSPKDSNPFVVKMTSVAIDDGRKNLTAFGKISLPTERTNDFLPSKELSIKPVSKSDLKLISDSMKKESFPQKVFTDEKGENVFNSKMSPGELLVPQKKYITMEIKTKTVRLPTTDRKSQPGPIPRRNNKDIRLRPIINSTPAPTPPSRPITIIKSTNLFISMGNQSRPTNKTNGSKQTPMKKSKSASPVVSDAEQKYKTAVQSLRPHCSGGSEILSGLMDAYTRLSDAKGWVETMKAFQTMTSDAAKALGLCFQKMWDDTKNLFGRKKRSSQIDVEKAAKDFTDNFKTDVGQPVARFFGELSDKISTALGKRSTPEMATLVLGNEAENDFIYSSLTRGARSQELISALGISPQNNIKQPIN